ncbi:MAG: hypothetical protein R3Y10_06345 [Ferrimonas sp.]
MTHPLIFNALGMLSIVLGLIFVCNPELIRKKTIPKDRFQAVERRIWWGLFIGIGIIFFLRQEFYSWPISVAIGGAAIIFGLLMARLIGLALDGSVRKQWLNVAIELVILGLFLLWYWWLK